jgi:hypothetical protein
VSIEYSGGAGATGGENRRVPPRLKRPPRVSALGISACTRACRPCTSQNHGPAPRCDRGCGLNGRARSDTRSCCRRGSYRVSRRAEELPRRPSCGPQRRERERGIPTGSSVDPRRGGRPKATPWGESKRGVIIGVAAGVRLDCGGGASRRNGHRQRGEGRQSSKSASTAASISPAPSSNLYRIVTGRPRVGDSRTASWGRGT